MCAQLTPFHKEPQTEQGKPEAAAAQGQAQSGQHSLRVAILPAPGMTTLYANAFQTSFAQGEILLTASSPGRSGTNRAQSLPCSRSRPWP